MSSAQSNLVEFWNDITPDINTNRTKRNIPTLPSIEDEFQVVIGDGIETLAYLMLQIQKSSDKSVLIRAMASACSFLLRDSTNFTGSKLPAVKLTGLEPAADDKTDPNMELTTNFIDSVPIIVAELLEVMSADSDEIGAYFGVMFLAGNKRITTDNRTAFNEKRRNAALASVVGEPKFFINNSPYLTDGILANMYAAFLSYSPLRAIMTQRVVQKLNATHMGPALAFINMFLLLVDSDMSALRIIKEAVLKYPWIRTEFPELTPEFAEANAAFNSIRRAPGNERSFLKAIHANSYVPVNYANIDNLTGVCKTVLKRTTPSYQNYNGGKITERQEQTILKQLGESSELVTAVAAE
jgi:hypothetical protein